MNSLMAIHVGSEEEVYFEWEFANQVSAYSDRTRNGRGHLINVGNRQLISCIDQT